MNKPNKVMTPAQETSVNIVRLVLDFIVRIIELCKGNKRTPPPTGEAAETETGKLEEHV